MNKEPKLKPKDAKAYKRYRDEIKLKNDISELLKEFSKKYDVECVNVQVQRNDFYGRTDTPCPMYLLDLCWKFDYMAHPE